MLAGKTYSFGNDIWMLGVTIFQFAALEVPWPANSVDELVKDQLNKRRRPLPAHYSKELNTIMDMMLELDQFKRRSARELLETKQVRKQLYELFQRRNDLDLKYYGETLVRGVKFDMKQLKKHKKLVFHELNEEEFEPPISFTNI